MHSVWPSLSRLLNSSRDDNCKDAKPEYVPLLSAISHSLSPLFPNLRVLNKFDSTALNWRLGTAYEFYASENTPLLLVVIPEGLNFPPPYQLEMHFLDSRAYNVLRLILPDIPEKYGFRDLTITGEDVPFRQFSFDHSF